MSKRQTQKENTRQKIRQTAKLLFAKQGFEATTIRQIAKESEVATGTLFIHFPNKNAVLADILYEDIEAVVHNGFATLPSHKSTKDKLMHLASALYSHYLVHKDLSRTLLKNSLFEESKSAGFATQIETFIEAITHLIEMGQKDGDVNQEKEAKEIATVFMASYFFVLMGLLRDDTETVKSAITQLGRLTEIIIV